MSLRDTVTVILIITVIGVSLFFTVSGFLWQLRCTDKCSRNEYTAGTELCTM